jgi:hypothetical protein
LASDSPSQQKIKNGKETWPPEVDIFVAAFVVAGRRTGKGGENRCAFFQQLTPSFADLALYHSPIVKIVMEKTV